MIARVSSDGTARNSHVLLTDDDGATVDISRFVSKVEWVCEVNELARAVVTLSPGVKLDALVPSVHIEESG